jgi:hypothetical protein
MMSLFVQFSAFESDRLQKKKTFHNSGRLNCLVWPGGSFNELSQFMLKVSELSGFVQSATTIVCSSLQEAASKLVTLNMNVAVELRRWLTQELILH